MPVVRVALVLLGVVLTTSPALRAEDRVQFNRDIRQILSDNCFACHGPDAKARQGELRLDVRDEALAKEAFVPGQADQSELIKRILSDDPDKVMPPPESNKKLTAEQKELFRRWVAEGAEYQGHWAYIPPVRPQVPGEVNAIDFLLERRLKAVGLEFSAAADRRTLLRRLSFDLLGLPPKPEEVEAFEKDQSPDAYAKVIERLLASPHYGERMAIAWLDVVRFADTIGYHSDNPRNVYPYRDYVIAAFNANKPFDQFTVEQLAGDLLPGSTLEQKVGSGFNRLLLTTEEGGAQAKDYEARMMADRVRAVGTVWLGQTLGCCQCHDHKFDPATARDFYSMGAFFADIQEPIIGRPEAGINVPTPEQAAQLEALQASVADLQKQYDSPQPELAERFFKWEQEQLALLNASSAWSSPKPSKVDSVGKTKLTVQPDNSILASGPKPEKETTTVELAGEQKGLVGLRLEVLPDDSLPAKGPGRASNGNFVVTEVVARLRKAGGELTELPFSSARATVEQTIAGEIHPDKVWSAASAIDGDKRGEQFGWAVLPEVGKPQALTLQFASPVQAAAEETLVVEIRQQHGQGHHTLGKFRLAVTAIPESLGTPQSPPPVKEIADLLTIATDQRTPPQKDKLFAHYKTLAPELADLRTKLDKARKEATQYEAGLPKTLISVSMGNPRTVRILPRGNWLDETGEIVQPALLSFLPKFETYPEGQRLSRLDLAKWVVNRGNPLTARVFVNRLWKQFFGTALSRNTDDLGSQGESPVDLELLDWLAVEFMESGWDVKHVVRLIVSTRAYQQSSLASKEQLAKDLDNRLCGRQSRFRLDAELVRDNALAVSALLAPKIGGPSVKPYQPPGYWENLNFPQREYDASPGQDQFRRGLYTWWQRSFVHPSMLAFDAPTREECCADRTRSNIPQQALVLLNDPTYVESAKAFAIRIQKDGGSSPVERLTWAWRQALQRSPSPHELATLQALFEKHLADYSKDAASADSLLATGTSPVPMDVNKPELAAWTSVARTILNLHEVITRN
jgi:hypothetical protein